MTDFLFWVLVSCLSLSVVVGILLLVIDVNSESLRKDIERKYSKGELDANL